MKKLTDFQIENLIESMIQKNKKTKRKELKEYYIKKWHDCSSKKERFEFFNEFFSTRKKMLKEGYDTTLNEGILMDLLGGGLGGFKSTFKEWISKKIVSGIASVFGAQVDKDLLNAISIGLANLDWSKDWTKLVSPVQNCEYIADQLMDSVLEYYVDKKVNQSFGDTVIGSALRNAVMDALADETHVQSIQNVITSVLCKALRAVFGGGNITNTIKSMMGGEKNAQTSPISPAGA